MLGTSISIASSSILICFVKRGRTFSDKALNWEVFTVRFSYRLLYVKIFLSVFLCRFNGKEQLVDGLFFSRRPSMVPPTQLHRAVTGWKSDWKSYLQGKVSTLIKLYYEREPTRSPARSPLSGWIIGHDRAWTRRNRQNSRILSFFAPCGFLCL